MGPKDMAHSHVTWGDRPVIVVSNNAANAESPVVTVVPITSRSTKLAFGETGTHVEISRELGLTRNSIAMAEQITTVDRDNLTRWLGAIDAETQQRLDEAIRKHLHI